MYLTSSLDNVSEESDAHEMDVLRDGPAWLLEQIQPKLSLSNSIWMLTNLKTSNQDGHPTSRLQPHENLPNEVKPCLFSLVEVIACDISLNHLFVFFLLFQHKKLNRWGKNILKGFSYYSWQSLAPDNCLASFPG